MIDTIFTKGDEVQISPYSRFYGDFGQLPPNEVGKVVYICEHALKYPLVVDWSPYDRNSYSDPHLLPIN